MSISINPYLKMKGRYTKMNKNMTVLHENNKGIKIIREDYKNRSKVNVISSNGYIHRTYRFNNVPEYKHPYLSWENLDHCGGWASDDTYLLTAVHNGKKPAAQYVTINEPVPNVKQDDNIETYYTSEKVYDNYTRNQVYITRTCSMKDLFDIDSIIEAYKKHDILLDKEELMPYMERPIMDLMKENFFLEQESETELVITGLMLGYPIESTASILWGY